MIAAKIENNIPLCNCCGKPLGNVKDIDVVEVKSQHKKFTRFVRECHTCGEYNFYLEEVLVSAPPIRLVADSTDISKVTSEIE